MAVGVDPGDRAGQRLVQDAPQDRRIVVGALRVAVDPGSVARLWHPRSVPVNPTRGVRVRTDDLGDGAAPRARDAVAPRRSALIAQEPLYLGGEVVAAWELLVVVL